MKASSVACHLGTACLLLTACTARVGEFTSQDEAAIRAASQRYVQTSLDGDWDAWADLIAPDAVYMIPNFPILEGRDAVVGSVRSLPPTSRLEIEPREIIGRGDIAVVRGSYAVDGDHGKYIEVWQRQADGAWRIIRDTWNSDRPAAAVPNPAAEEDAITDVVHATGAALNRRDWLGAAAVFSEDGDVILPGSPRVSGRAAIRDFWERAWADAPPDRRITLSVGSIRLLGSDVAIVECTAEFSAGEPARDRATYVLVRSSGRWEVAALRVMQAEGA